MAKIYYNLIKAEQWTIANVPTRWKTDVQTLLDADENAA